MQYAKIYSSFSSQGDSRVQLPYTDLNLTVFVQLPFW